MFGDESVDVNQQSISQSIGQQQHESTTTSHNIELGDLSPPAPFSTQSASVHSTSDIGESTPRIAPYGAELRRRGLLDGESDSQRTQHTLKFERPQNPEDDHQSTTRNDDKNPAVSFYRPGPVDDPRSSFNPLSTSSSTHAAVAVPGSPALKHDHRNEFFVDTNSLDHQDNSGSGQQQYEAPRERREREDSHSVRGGSRKSRRPMDDLSSSTSVSSQLPVLLSTSSHAVNGFSGQSDTDNDQGPVESRSTSGIGRTEHGIEQTYLGFGQQNKGPAGRIPKPWLSTESSSLSERGWEMAKGVQAIKGNFQIVMEHLRRWLADSGDEAPAIRKLCEEWNSLQFRFSSIIQKGNQMASLGAQAINEFREICDLLADDDVASQAKLENLRAFKQKLEQDGNILGEGGEAMFNINSSLMNLRRDVQSFGFNVPQPIANDQLIARISTLEKRITKLSEELRTLERRSPEKGLIVVLSTFVGVDQHEFLGKSETDKFEDQKVSELDKKRDELEKALHERNSIESDQRTVYFDCSERIMEIGLRLGAISDIWLGLSSDTLELERQLEGNVNKSIDPNLFKIKVKTTRGMCDKLYMALHAYTHPGEELAQSSAISAWPESKVGDVVVNNPDYQRIATRSGQATLTDLTAVIILPSPPLPPSLPSQPPPLPLPSQPLPQPLSPASPPPYSPGAALPSPPDPDRMSLCKRILKLLCPCIC